MTRITADSMGRQLTIVDRLNTLRQRVRLLLAVHGVGLLLGVVAGAALVLGLADYFIHFRPTTRIVLLMTLVVAVGVIVWRRLLSPLSTQLADQFLASRVENVNKDLADELISAVGFIEAGTPTGNALAAKAVEAAEARAKGIRFEDALDFGPAMKVLGAGLLLAVITALVVLLNPVSAKTAWARWSDPLGGAMWPQMTHVKFLWDTADGKAPKVLPQGEQVEIRAQVTSPRAKHLRVFLHSWTDGSTDAMDLMTLQPGESSDALAVYSRTIEPMGTREIHVKLEAGDDSEQSPVDIRLARRPEIGQMGATIAPPAYVKNLEDPTKPVLPSHVDLMQQVGRAVEESEITIAVRSTNPLWVNEHGEPDVRFLDQSKDTELPIAGVSRSLEGGDKYVASVKMKAKESLHARVVVRDENGFENRVGGAVNLDVVPDAFPSVVISEPRQAIRRVPEAAVKVRVDTMDDLGVDGGKYRVDNFTAKPDAPAMKEGALTWTSRAADVAAGSVSAKSDFDWDLAPLKLKEGDRLMLYALVQDNYDINGKRHEWVKSAPLSVTIISQAMAEDEARQELMQVRDQVESMHAQEDTRAAKVRSLKETMEKSQSSTPEQTRELGELAQQEALHAQNAKAVQQKIEQVQQRLAENKMSESDLAKVAEFAQQGMKDVAQNNMPKAASNLTKAQDAAGKQADPKAGKDAKAQAAKDAAKSAGEASEQQQQAMNTMQDVIKKLDEQNSIGKVRSDVAQLIKKETDIQKDVQKANLDNLGKKPEELAKDAKENLDRLKKEQDDAQKKTADVLDNMKKMAEKMQNDQASKESLEKAAQAGKDEKVTDSQSDASGQISKNELGKASSSAGKAKAGLEKVKDELDKISQRQLEKLSQDLAELIDRLKEHVVRQTGIQEDTTKAGDKADKTALRPLGDREGTLHLNTIESQKKAEATKDAREAAALVRTAAEKMQGSASGLFGGKQAESLPPMADAITALNDAIKKLEEQKKKVDDDLKEKDLAYFIGQYQKIKDGEVEVKTASDQVNRQLAARQALDKNATVERNEGSLLNTKAKQQDELISQLHELTIDDKLKEYDAVIYLNGQISGYMTISKDRLTKALLDRELAYNQQKAIDRLQDIIDALKEEKAKKDEFDKPSGGGGGGGGGKPPLIPPAQQLKLLKALQVVVNKDTTERHQEITTAKDAAEKNVAADEVKKLGAQEGKIQEIATKVIEKLKQ